MTLSLVGLDSARSQPPCFNTTECGNVFGNFTNGNFTCSDGNKAALPGDCNYLCANSSTNSSPCATFDGNICVHALCSEGNCSLLEEFVPPSCQDDNPCTNNSCDVCGNNCTGQCVVTPITNSTMCNVPLGGGCTLNDQCTSGFCADGVCCNTPCDGPTDSCVMPGFVGHCVAPAAAPAISWRGMLIVGFLLLAIGTLGVRALQRAHQRALR